MYKKWNNNKNVIYFGVSYINWIYWIIPLIKGILIGQNKSFKSIKEMMYGMTLSSRIPPFYRSFGHWNGIKWIFDGGLTHNFAISKYDKLNRNIISISCFSNNYKDTICPNENEQVFKLNDIIKHNANLKEQIRS
eukprot:266424_1